MSFFELIGRALFESIDELHEIGGVRETFTKEMNMVGHDAIGMQRKIPLSGNFHEMTEQPFPPGLIREKSRVPLGPNGHEIMLATAVVFRGTSQAFFIKGHVKRLTPNVPVGAGLQFTLRNEGFTPSNEGPGIFYAPYNHRRASGWPRLPVAGGDGLIVRTQLAQASEELVGAGDVSRDLRAQFLGAAEFLFLAKTFPEFHLDARG
jgi:hypothetical protein